MNITEQFCQELYGTDYSPADIEKVGKILEKYFSAQPKRDVSEIAESIKDNTLRVVGSWLVHKDATRLGDKITSFASKGIAEALEQAEMELTELKKRDGNWIDKWGACKLCDGELPHGHTENCDLYKVEKERDALRQQLEQAQADCAAKDEALKLIARIHFQECGHTCTCDVCKALQPNSGTAILERLRKAEEDSKRLDWLEAMYHRPEFLMSLSQDARQAIDSAIAAQSKGGEWV